MSHVYGNFIEDEYTHTLRLESKLSDLWVGYANPCVCIKHALYSMDGRDDKKESTLKCALFFVMKWSEA